MGFREGCLLPLLLPFILNYKFIKLIGLIIPNHLLLLSLLQLASKDVLSDDKCHTSPIQHDAFPHISQKSEVALQDQ